MAFSTQKEFFHIPYINESYELNCTGVCVNLKTYPSSIDDRSWSENEEKKSRFVADLVACNNPIFVKHGNENFKNFIDTYGSNLLLEDSLINAADDAIDWLQDLMKRNILNNQLPESDMKLLSIKMDNAEIKRIINQRYNRDNARTLQVKLNGWISSKNELHEEKELKEIIRTIDDMDKTQDLLEAENAYLKRIIEKQSIRCRLDSLEINPEQSTDVEYLQRKINEMAKELSLLRQTEDMLIRKCAQMCRSECNEAFKIEGVYMNNAFSLEQDILNIQRILQERDALRKKCKNLEALGEKLNALEQKANEAENISEDLEDNINQQNQYINDIQQEMDKMKNYYENEVDKAKGLEKLLTCRCNQVMQELLSARCAAQRTECQQIEIEELHRQLLKRDIALNEYDCQYQQLMVVVCELNRRYCNQHGSGTGVVPAYSPEMGDDLAFYTRVTLDHIMNELCKQSDCFKFINQNRSSEDPAINSLEECTLELGRLRKLLTQQTDSCQAVKNEKKETSYSVDKCNQELERLNDLLKQKDEQLEVLIEENECLCMAAEISKNKLDDLDNQVQKLDEDTRHMEQGIVESIGLIQDIGDVSHENELLKGKISQLEDGEARQLISDLSKQLEDCREQSRLIREINDEMGKTLQKFGINPEEIENKVKLIESSKREFPDKDLSGMEPPVQLKEHLSSIKESGKDLEKTLLPASRLSGEAQNNDIKEPESIKEENKGTGLKTDREAINSHLSGKVHGVAIEGEKLNAVVPESTKKLIEEQGSGAGVEIGRELGVNSGSIRSLLKANDSVAKNKDDAITGNGGVGNEQQTGGKQQNLQSAKDGVIPNSSVTEKHLGYGESGGTRKEKVTATGEEKIPAPFSGQNVSKMGPAGSDQNTGRGKESVIGQSVKQAVQSNRIQKATKPDRGGLDEDINIRDQGAEKNGSNEAKPLEVPKSGAGSAQAASPGLEVPKSGAGSAQAASPGLEVPKSGAGSAQAATPGLEVPKSGAGSAQAATPGLSQGIGLTVAQEMTTNPNIPSTKQGPKSMKVHEPTKSTDQGAILGPGAVKDDFAKSRAEVTLPGDQSKNVRGIGLSGQRKRSSAAEDTKESKFGNKIYKNKGDKSLTSESASSGHISHSSSVLIKIGISNKMGKRISSRCRDGGQFDDFVKHTVQSLSAGDIDGCALEKELRKILDMFIDECGFCFCKCNVPKSRFYAICHKLYHHGLHTLDFRELTYMHKRIYAAAENILPGCLFNMIVKEMTRFSCTSTDNRQYASNTLNTQSLQKCCTCKTTFCCDTNEEKLLHKVIRLESDIESAKTCLKNLKSIPSHLSIPRCRFSLEDFSAK
uniref:Coiled-Coils Y n=2 Tax=Drosophila melanogaster TaxID=7227 RepID=A0A0S0X8W1_DROME|nr:Coiled-Coils Y [Drosophila melanogaster]ALI51689.1 Coiled-Coils Y [Drosophila melanogaster]|eukprot:NP_001303589.1 Coiled-Coils Y [Drosophila melanogaster]